METPKKNPYVSGSKFPSSKNEKKKKKSTLKKAALRKFLTYNFLIILVLK